MHVIVQLGAKSAEGATPHLFDRGGDCSLLTGEDMHAFV